MTASYTNGLDGVAYDARDCYVASGGNDAVVCRTAPGVAAGHYWTLLVEVSGVRREMTAW